MAHHGRPIHLVGLGQLLDESSGSKRGDQLVHLTGGQASTRREAGLTVRTNHQFVRIGRIPPGTAPRKTSKEILAREVRSGLDATFGV
jgi:hypothetical protein